MSNRVRKVGVSIRLGDWDEALINAKKDEADMTKSEYLRTIILFGIAHERPFFSEDFAAPFIAELNTIGIHVNNIARGVNIFRCIYPSDLEQLKFLFIDLMTVYDKYVRNYTRNPY
jgi:hypothetical protein